MDLGYVIQGAGVGRHVFTLTVTDAAGNQAVVTNAFAIYPADSIAPSTTDDAPTDWQNQDVTVHFAATDNAGGSGVQYTEYSTDGKAHWTKGGSVTIAALTDHSHDGSNVVWYRSTDNMGNTETAKSCTVRMDTQAPTVSGLVPADGQTYVMGLGTTVAWTAADLPSGAGLASQGGAAATIDDQPVAVGDPLDAAGQGAHVFALTLTDKAGNQTQVSSAFTAVAESLTVSAPGAGDLGRAGRARRCASPSSTRWPPVSSGSGWSPERTTT